MFLYIFKGSFLHQNHNEPGSSDDKARLEAVLRGEPFNISCHCCDGLET